MNKWIGLVILVVLVILGFFVIARSGQKTMVMEKTQPTVEAISTAQQQPTTSPSASPSGAITATGSVKEITIAGSNFAFDKSEIRVNQGDTVKLTFKNSGGVHDWRLDEFNAGTKIISGGQSETIQFVVNKKGTFEYYCSVGNHRQMGMKGAFIVE